MHQLLSLLHLCHTNSYSQMLEMCLHRQVFLQWISRPRQFRLPCHIPPPPSPHCHPAHLHLHPAPLPLTFIEESQTLVWYTSFLPQAHQATPPPLSNQLPCPHMHQATPASPCTLRVVLLLFRKTQHHIIGEDQVGPVYKEFQLSPCLLYPEPPPSTCTLPPSPPTPLTTPPFLPCHHHYQLQLTANLLQAHVRGSGLTVGRNLPPLSPTFA